MGASVHIGETSYRDRDTVSSALSGSSVNWVLAVTFVRAFGIVTCTAANVSYIASGRIGHAFVTGFLISLIWWHNARSAAHSEHRFGGIVYALGAACGTIAGMTIGALPF